MKLLVIGASRGIGLEVVKQALSRGYEVRAFARSAASIRLSNPRLEKRSGSALNASDVASAMPGVDAVVLTLGVRAGPGMVLGPIHLFSKATQIVIDAMKKACVRRLICVTGFGAGDSRAKLGLLQAIFFELLLGRAYEDKDAQETLVKRSGLDWIIVRPVLLTNGPNTGRYKVLDHPKDWRSGTISRADVADFLLKQVQDSSYLGKTPVLTN
jgi:putative NADH-flavin reductase